MKYFSLFIFLLFCTFAYSQNDCVEAIIICGNSDYQGLTATGIGTQELNNTNTCQSMEHNSLWLELPIKTGGNLGFTLIPTSTSIVVDFDFFIFGPNVACGNIGQAIRCSTTNPAAAGSANNHTGMNGTETDTAEGPGQLGNNFIQWLPVQAGETYFLVIDRPIGSSDFSIQWTGTAEFHDIPFIDPNISLNQKKCDDNGGNDQSASFDLTENNSDLIGNQQDVVLSFHENLNDVTTGTNPITNPQSFENIFNPQTIYIRMTNTVTGCFSTGSFQVKVDELTINAGNPKDLSLCDLHETGHRQFDLSQNTAAVLNGIPDATVVYYASLEDAENQQNPLGNIHQNQKAYATETIWARLDYHVGCTAHDITSFTITVEPLEEIVYTLEVVDFTQTGNSISIIMDNPENYAFSIDGIHFSEKMIFENLGIGKYTIYIRNKNGCKQISEEVVILDYPKFFTPNADGFNDVWQIPFLDLKPGSKINIFDRYGKLVSNINRWDGTYNGKALPSDDYWFSLELPEGRIIKGHFSLIR